MITQWAKNQKSSITIYKKYESGSIWLLFALYFYKTFYFELPNSCNSKSYCVTIAYLPLGKCKSDFENSQRFIVCLMLTRISKSQKNILFFISFSNNPWNVFKLSSKSKSLFQIPYFSVLLFVCLSLIPALVLNVKNKSSSWILSRGCGNNQRCCRTFTQ